MSRVRFSPPAPRTSFVIGRAWLLRPRSIVVRISPRPCLVEQSRAGEQRDLVFFFCSRRHRPVMARRAGLERVDYMARNPVAGAAYAVATLAGASPQARDRAMVAGGALNAVALSAAPLGARTRRPPVRYPSAQIAPPTLARAPIRYGTSTSTGQATGANATVTKSMLRSGGRVRKGLTLPGLIDSGKQDRSHLIAKLLGGAARSPQEVVPLDRRANRGSMRTFEESGGNRVRAGEILEYFVSPLYRSGNSAPSAVIMSAHGSRGGVTPRVIQNRIGARQ
jgi:hypothetical protein